MATHLIIPAILRVVGCNRCLIVRRWLGWSRRATHLRHSIPHQAILHLVLQDVRENLGIETARLISACSRSVQITYASGEVHRKLWQQLQIVEFLLAIEWNLKCTVCDADRWHTLPHRRHIERIIYRRIVVILHLRRLIIKTQTRSETPTLTSTQRRLVIECQTVCWQLKIAIQHKWVNRQELLDHSRHIAQNKVVDSTLQHTHWGVHINLLVEAIRTRNPLPATR